MERIHFRTLRPVSLLALTLIAGVFPISGSDEKSAALGPGPLPEPPRSGGASLIETLWKRRSVRSFADRPITREELGFILWAAAGINRPAENHRTTPAAWGAYAVSVYVTSKDGTCRYDPPTHSLKAVEAAREKDLRREIPTAEFTKAAPAVLILVADFSRYGGRAPKEFLRDMAHADSGVIAQDIYLAAAAVNLGTVMTADVRPEAKGILGLGSEESALYTLPLGHPKEGQAEGAKR